MMFLLLNYCPTIQLSKAFKHQVRTSRGPTSLLLGLKAESSGRAHGEKPRPGTGVSTAASARSAKLRSEGDKVGIQEKQHQPHGYSLNKGSCGLCFSTASPPRANARVQGQQWPVSGQACCSRLSAPFMSALAWLGHCPWVLPSNYHSSAIT